MGAHGHARLGSMVADFGAKDVFLLSDEGIVRTEGYALIEETLRHADIGVSAFTAIEPSPSDGTVDQAFSAYGAHKSPVVVALGGGSVMDVAKAVAMLATNGGKIHQYEGFDKFTIPPLPLIAIPTTAGTGSEVSAVCSITDTTRGLKMSIRNAALNPARIAILDPVMLKSLPKDVAIHAGMDAFTHALESYVSKHSNPLTDAGNLYAIELVARNIRRFVEDRNDLDSGLDMLCSASLGAIGFSSTGAGNIHCMARFVSAFFQVPHGLATAVCLPGVAEYNAEAVPEKFARVAVAMGEPVDGAGTKDAAHKGVSAIMRLCRDLGIPEHLEEVGVKSERIPEMTEKAFAADYNRWNPRYTSAEDFRLLFETML
jgi:alcohol dehydrogenase